MIVRFHGHACFEVTDAATSLCIDPYEAGALGGAVQLPPLPNHFDGWVATHEHVDHNAGHTIPSARRLRPTAASSDVLGPFTVEARVAFHDEFGGRLRGGMVDMLRVRCGASVLVHVGDLGERPVGDTLAWLCEVPTDVLIVPAGGYFTLGVDGAAELIELVRPRVAVLCHTADDGVALPQLVGEHAIRARFPDIATVDQLDLSDESAMAAAAVVRMRRSPNANAG